MPADPDAVLMVVQTLMAPRLTESSFSSGSNVQWVGEFTDKTRPPLDAAEAVVTRHAGMVGWEYPGVPAGVGSYDALMGEIAGLRAAIELEGSFFPEQVETGRSPVLLWERMLDRATSRLDALLNSPADPDAGGGDGGAPGGVALAPSWSFGSGCVPRAPGAECPHVQPCSCCAPRW
jgi:hypothetical protein